MGLAPQEVNLDWFLTVEETLDYHGGYFGMHRRERRERTRELLEAFSLAAKRDDRTTLSGGMKRRLLLARALMHRPRLLILDEPTAGVDVELRLQLWRYVQRINAEGTTILVTTHYLEEAEDAYLELVGRKELSRARRQTVGAPLLETFLFISVFGAAWARGSTSSTASTTSCSSFPA